MTAKEALQQAKYFAHLANLGVISYDEAKAKSAPFLAIVNDFGKELAKKYNQTYKPVSFAGIRR